MFFIFLVNLFCVGLVWDDADGSDNFGPFLDDGASASAIVVGAPIAATRRRGETAADGSEVEERDSNADPERYHFCCQSCSESRSNKHHASETKEKGKIFNPDISSHFDV